MREEKEGGREGGRGTEGGVCIREVGGSGV